MKSFVLKIMSMLLLVSFVACGNGTNTGNPTPDPGCGNCGIGPADEETLCEASGGILLSETECECPDENIIDPDEECPAEEEG
ncbi:hypothetical protein K1X76_00285 [bacterium]|nr:hypothetical protein [bacterium]